MSNAEEAITHAASQLPQEEGGGDEHRKRGNDSSFALSDDGSQDGRLEEQNRRQSTATVTDGAEAKTPAEKAAEVHESDPDPVVSRLLTTSVLLQRRHCRLNRNSWQLKTVCAIS